MKEAADWEVGANHEQISKSNYDDKYDCALLRSRIRLLISQRLHRHRHLRSADPWSMPSL